MIVTRNVTPIKSVTRAVTVPVTRDDVAVSLPVQIAWRRRIEALEIEVAELRKLVAALSAPSNNKRAAYMREYRKLHPKDK